MKIKDYLIFLAITPKTLDTDLETRRILKLFFNTFNNLALITYNKIFPYLDHSIDFAHTENSWRNKFLPLYVRGVLQTNPEIHVPTMFPTFEVQINKSAPWTSI